MLQVVRQAEQVEDFLDHDDGGEGSAERQRHEARQPPPGPGAEREGAEPLEPAQIDRAAAVDARRPHRQLAVGAQQRVAAQELAPAGQVRELELVARHGVAQLAQRQEAALGHAVEEFLHQLSVGDALGEILRQEADIPEGVREHGTEALA